MQFGRPKGFVPALSLVADESGKILGHVILSYVALDTGQRLLELGPLSVCPERQGKGIGGDLVRTALGIADELNEPLVLVLGFPAYYRRFRFQRASAFGIAPPDGIPDDPGCRSRCRLTHPRCAGRSSGRPRSQA
jgi:putative acetyltransferase